MYYGVFCICVLRDLYHIKSLSISLSIEFLFLFLYLGHVENLTFPVPSRGSWEAF